jgi:katanin p60 ATPase-containing subunit A1
MLQRYKAEGQSRIAEEKLKQERRRNLLVMIYRHLITCGYSDAATHMERECNVELTKYEMADNMDFIYVLQDYEEYFEIKF